MRRFVLVDDAFKRPLAPIRKRLPGDRASGTEPPRDFACGVDGKSVEPCAVRQRVTGAGTGDKWGKFRDRDVVPGEGSVSDEPADRNACALTQGQRDEAEPILIKGTVL